MATAVHAYVALGSNLGDRAGYLAAARVALAMLPDTRLVAASSVEETAPLGALEQPPYLNQMVLLETALAPRDLLTALQTIEIAHGRGPHGHWASRTLDLDIVQYDDLTLTEPDLVLPHPGLRDREFWQREFAELSSHG